MKQRYWVILVYFFLIAIGVPWYWSADNQQIIFGVPLWFFVSILVSVIASLFTAYLLLRYPWNTEVGDDD